MRSGQFAAETANVHGIALPSSEALGRSGVVREGGGERGGGFEFAGGVPAVAAGCEQPAELKMDLEGGGGVGLCVGGEIVAQAPLGEVGRAVGGGEDAGGIDQHGAVGAVGGEAGLDGGERVVGAGVGLVELGEVDPGFGRALHGDGALELGFGGGEVVVGIGEAREQAMGGGGEARHHAGGEGLGLVVASADDEGRRDIVFAEVVRGRRRWRG